MWYTILNSLLFVTAPVSLAIAKINLFLSCRATLPKICHGRYSSGWRSPIVQGIKAKDTLPLVMGNRGYFVVLG